MAEGAKWRSAPALTWVLRVLLAVVFLSEGAGKFPDSRMWTRVFDQIGFGQWFRFFTGVVEVVGALMLLVPRATLLGVGLLACTMIGALLVHVLVIGVGRHTVFAGVLLLMLLIVGKRAAKRDRREIRTSSLEGRQQAG